MLEFKRPIPVITPLGDGYAIYAVNSGSFENDIWTIVLCEGGYIKHFNTSQIQIYKNATLDITQ